MASETLESIASMRSALWNLRQNHAWIQFIFQIKVILALLFLFDVTQRLIGFGPDEDICNDNHTQRQNAGNVQKTPDQLENQNSYHYQEWAIWLKFQRKNDILMRQ